MNGLEGLLLNLLEHLRSGGGTLATALVLVVFYGPALGYFLWRSSVLRRVESAYQERIRYLEDVADRGLTLASERILLLENLLRERDELLRTRDKFVESLMHNRTVIQGPNSSSLPSNPSKL